MIETYECESKKEALLREKYYIDELGASLNTIKSICLLTKHERDKIYNEAHKEEWKNRDQNNNEHIQQYRKERYQKNSEHFKNISKK